MAEDGSAVTAAYDAGNGSDGDREPQLSPANDADEDDDYDPSAFSFDERAGAGDATATHPSPKPKTIGGFIVDDEDDDEEETDEVTQQPPSQLNSTTGEQAGLGAATDAEAAVQDVPIASEPQDSAAVPSAHSARPNGHTPVPVSTSAAPAPPVSDPASTLSLPKPLTPVSDQGKQAPTPTPAAPSATATPQPPNPSPAVPAPAQTNIQIPQPSTNQRLPHDKVGQLEDRIKEDPKGDTEAWRSLIAHYREKGQLDNARKIYSRFFEVFPSAASMWVEYAQLELEYDQFRNLEQIFSLSLLQLPNVDMWTVYLDYLRRIHPLQQDTDGSKRNIITSAFDLLLENVGIDPDSGKLWREYVEFVKSGPGTIGGTGWQDLQKVDLLRKAYQKAIKLPHSELSKLWKEYDNFELSLNKATGRKYLQENSPSYMTARSAKTVLDQKIDGLDRKSLPTLPPIYGCVGDDAFAAQLDRWRDWIAWEKEDPIMFKEDDIAVYRKRIIYAYKQATMQLRFYPDLWFDAATWCFEEGIEDMITEGEAFLQKGIEANPESVLLALMKADRVESSLEAGSSDEIAIRNGEKLDPVFEGVIKPLYALHKKTVERIQKGVAQIQERYAAMTPEEEPEDANADDDDNKSDASSTVKPKTRTEKLNEELDAYRSRMAEYTDQLRNTISYMWIAKMRAFRRIQGQGQPGKAKKGLRGVFGEARPQGQLTSAVYIASAQMEWACYRDPSAARIFERGYKLFPLDEVFTLEYIKHLFANNDAVNANATFNTFLSKVKNSDKFSLEQRRAKCRPILEYMHEYQSNFGDWNQIHRIEREMAELYPEESDVARFGARNALPNFDAMRLQLLISPSQALPKTTADIAGAAAATAQHPYPSIEYPRSPPEGISNNNIIRLGPNGPYVASPKRALEDVSDSEAPQRKFQRGESPFKAGHHSNNSGGGGGGGAGFMTKTYVPPHQQASFPPLGPAPLPSQLHYLLSVLPSAAHYHATPFDPHKMVEFLRGVNLGRARI